MASLNFTALELSLFSCKKQRSKLKIKRKLKHFTTASETKSYQEHLQKNKPQEMVTQYARNKPASWPFNVKPSLAKKRFTQSKFRMIHALCSASNLRARAEKIKKPLFKQTHKVTSHIIMSLGVVFSLSTLISKLSCAKIIGSFKLHVSLWLADSIGIS